MLLKELSKEGERLTYGDMGHLLMAGAIWEKIKLQQTQIYLLKVKN
jgi:hypothetical protein